MPTPESRTSTTTQPDASAAARIASAPPLGMASTALWMRRTRASRSSKALPSTGGSASMSWVTAMTMPLRSASSRQRGAVSSSASRDHRGQAHRPEGDLRLAGDELLQLANRRGGLEGHVADHHEPAPRRLRLALAEHQLGVGEDRGERVVEVVGEPAHRLAEDAQVLAAGEPARSLGQAAPEVARPAAHREDRAVHLHLGAADLARDVLDLLVVGEEEGFRRQRRGGRGESTGPSAPGPA